MVVSEKLILILRNHIMKNFQVKHGQCDSVILPQNICFEGSKLLLDICLADNRILYFSYFLKSISITLS